MRTEGADCKSRARFAMALSLRDQRSCAFV